MTIPIGPGPFIPSGPSGPSGGGPIDTSSRFSIEGGVTIQQYSQIISQALDEFLELLFDSQRQEQLLSREVYRHLGESAAALLASLNGIRQHITLTDQVVDLLDLQTDTQNAEIDSINSGVPTEDSQIGALNSAIDDYNNGLITDIQLQDAVNTYEAYRAGRNAEIDAYNTNVDLYNLEMLAYNIVTLAINQQRQEFNETYSVENVGEFAAVNFPYMPTIPFLLGRPELSPGPTAPFTAPVPTLATIPAEVSLTPIPEPPPVDDINSDITALNLLIDQYNLGVSSDNPSDITEEREIAVLNQAIQAFNNGQISSAQLQSAVDDYNSYKSSRDAEINTLNSSVTTFISAIPGYNTTIDQVNLDREGFGLLPLSYIPEESRLPSEEAIEAGVPSPDLITTRSLMPTAPSGPFIAPVDLMPARGDYASVDLIGQADIGTLISSTLLGPIFDKAFPFLADLRDKIISTDDYIRALLFFLPGRASVIPESVIERSDKIRPAQGTPPRASYSALSIGLSSPNLEGIMAQGLFDAIPKELNIKDPNLLVQQAALLGLQVLQRAGLAATLPAISTLVHDLPSLKVIPYMEISGTPLNIIYSLSFAREVRKIIISGVVEESITGFIAQNPELASASAALVRQLVEALSAALNIRFLLIGLLQLALALQAPGLISQLLGQLPLAESLPPGIVAVLENALAPPTFQELLSDPFISGAVSNIVINSFLAEEGLLGAGRTGRIRVNGLISSIRQAVSQATLAGDPLGAFETLSQQLTAIGFGPLDRAVAATNIRETLQGVGASPQTIAGLLPYLNQLSGPLPSTNEERLNLLTSIASALGNAGLPEAITTPLINSVARLLTETVDERAPPFRQIALRAILFVLELSSFVELSQRELNAPIPPAAIGAEQLRGALTATGLLNEAKIEEIVVNALRALFQKSEIRQSIVTATLVQEQLVRALLTREVVLRDLVLRDVIENSVIRHDLTIRALRRALIEQLSQETDINDAVLTAEQTINQLRNDYILNERLQLALIDQGVLRDSIVDNYVQRGILESEAIRRAAIVVDTLKYEQRAYESASAYRNAVADILVNAFGETPSAAAAVAASLNLGINEPDALPLVTPGLQTPVSLQELRALLADQLDATLVNNIENKRAAIVRDLILNLLIDDDISYRVQLRDQIERLRLQQDIEHASKLGDLFRNFVNLNVDLYAFADRLKDPGFALVHAVWGGLQYTDNLPSNFKKDIDIRA